MEGWILLRYESDYMRRKSWIETVGFPEHRKKLGLFYNNRHKIPTFVAKQDFYNR